MASQDAIYDVMPYLLELARHDGDWLRTLFRPYWLGGVELVDLVGCPPIYAWGIKLGFSTTSIINLSAFYLQLCYGYLSTRSAIFLSQLNSGVKKEPDFFNLIGAWGLTAFAPVLAWRLCYGHFGLLFGTLPPLITMAMMLSVMTRNTSITLLGMSFLGLLHGMPSKGQQTLFSSLVFGTPVLIALLINWIGNRSTFKSVELARVSVRQVVLLPGLVILSAIAVSFPKYSNMLANALSSDFSRDLNGSSTLTYSLGESTWNDWLSSITWKLNAIKNNLPHYLVHETNYPIGSLVLFLLLFPWKRWKSFGIALLLSVTTVLLFSTRTEPVAELLLNISPP